MLLWISSRSLPLLQSKGINKPRKVNLLKYVIMTLNSAWYLKQAYSWGGRSWFVERMSIGSQAHKHSVKLRLTISRDPKGEIKWAVIPPILIKRKPGPSSFVFPRFYTVLEEYHGGNKNVFSSTFAIFSRSWRGILDDGLPRSGIALVFATSTTRLRPRPELLPYHPAPSFEKNVWVGSEHNNPSPA